MLNVNRWINRLIFWLSLVGMILAIHLWIQKARGFDQGCLGLTTHAMASSEGGCTDQTLQAGSHLMGVSNAAWGYAFYFGMAVLSFGKLVMPSAWSRRLHVLAEILVVAAFFYSAYLLYFQAFVAEVFCMLCVISIILIAMLLIMHVVLRLCGGWQPMPDTSRTMELGLASGSFFVAMGVLVGVLVFVNRLGTRPLDEGNGSVEMRRIVGRMLPAYLDPNKMQEFRACHFDGMAPSFDFGKFIGPATPFMGKSDGLPVIVFLDPHCPHCRHFYPLYLKLVEKYRDQARFYILPNVLWDYSIPAVAALKLAEPSGKYFDLWRLELDRQGRKSLTVEQLAGFYASMGLESTELAKRIEAVRPQVIADHKHAIGAGISEAPAIFIGSKRVFASNYSEECLESLIEDALSTRSRALKSE